MEHNDHVRLLQGEPGLRERLGLPLRSPDGGSDHSVGTCVWADFGAGSGAFTLALADLLGPGARIYAIDRNIDALRSLTLAMRKTFPGTIVDVRATDFLHPLTLPFLDGLVMANSLHFVPDREKAALIRRLGTLLRPGGQFLLVEYNVDRGNPWVPYPLSYPSWEKLADSAGYTKISRLAARPSRFLGEIYSAVAVREG